MSEATIGIPGRLRVRTKLGFGVCDLGGNLFFTALGFWALNYLTDTVAIPAAIAGIIIMVGKAWDAFADPVMGYISDRTRTRWGRRRPYLFFGAFPLFLAMWWFFSAPAISSPVLLAIWAGFAFALLNTAYTVVNIPYSSLTPELTKDFHERSSLNGYRFGFAVIGTIIGAGAVQPIIGLFGGNKHLGFSMMGLIFGALMLVTALITAFSVREPDHSKDPLPTEKLLETYKAVFRNRPYVIILMTYALHLLGLNFLQGILVYYFKYIYRDEGMTTMAMILLLLVAMVFIPVSVLVSKRIGKKLTYQICFFILSTGSLAIFALGHILGPKFFLGVMVYAGIGVGFGYVAPFAMVPDAIEYDAVLTGKRKEGAFYGMWTFMSKIGIASSILITGAVLSIARFVPNVDQGPSSLLAIRLLIGPFPAFFLIGAMVLLYFYPLDERTYAELIAKHSRGGGDGSEDRGSH